MRKFLLLLTMLGSLCCFAAEKDALRVVLKTGSPMLFKFESKPEVTFTPEGFDVVCPNEEGVVFQFDEVDYLDFAETVGIVQLPVSELLFWVGQTSITVENAGSESRLDVWTLDGKSVLSATFNDTYTIERPRLGKGVFIFKINNSTFKASL